MHEIPIETVTRRSGASLTRGNFFLLAFAPRPGPGVRAARRRTTASRPQKVQEFQYATPGQPLLEVFDDRSLEVELIAPSRWLAWLKPGYVFAIHVEETDKTYKAAITRVGGRVDPVSQTIKVFGEIQGEAGDLMAGMSGRANIAPPQ
jgi:HlyD family secretion protein